MIPSKPHFFKPLIPGFENGISIPVSFFKYLKGQECNKATLRSPRGKLWPIKVNDRRFENGWKEFAQDHELHVGDFLVFRHAGGLVFDVLVLDPTTCEREYPPFTIKEEKIEIQEQEPATESPIEKFKKKKQKITELEGKASSSVLEHPYYVIKLAHYSARGSKLSIPKNFAREHCLHKTCCEVIIKDQEGSSWPAKVWRKKSDEIFIGCGWTDFRVAHDLKLGNLLIVELIENANRPVLRIRRLEENPEIKKEVMHQNAQAGSSSHEPSHPLAHIKAFYRKNSQPSVSEKEVAKEFGSTKPKKNKQPMTALEAKASACALQHPFFVARVTRHAFGKYLYIPTRFARLHFQSNRCRKIILIDQKERHWPAILSYRRSGSQVYIADGWKAFCAANELKPGDCFIFELIIKGERPVLKMSGNKANPKAKKNLAFHQNVEAGSSSRKHPYFYVTMKAYCINGYNLKIQRNFARRNGLTSKCSEMILKNEMGNSWLVSLRPAKDGGLFVSHGWLEFVKENDLKEEDVLMIELVRGGATPMMKFYALKRGRALEQMQCMESDKAK